MTHLQTIWRAYIIPGAVFQSLMVGGGYGTGREIVEYFTRFGAVGGLLGLALTTMCFAVLLPLSYEFARRFHGYDYRNFFRPLLGQLWPAFEVLYVTMFALVLAVVCAAAGSLFEHYLHCPRLVGMSILLFLLVLAAFYGRTWVTRLLAYKAGLLCVVVIGYFTLVSWRYHERIAAQLMYGEVLPGWAYGAARYALYSSVVIPAMLFATRSIASTRQAVTSGLTTALAGIFPAVLMHLSFAGQYPAVILAPVPTYWIIAGLDSRLLMAAYLFVLFGSLFDVGLGFIQSVNERIDGWSMERTGHPASARIHAAVALFCVLISGALSLVGIIPLIARGYGAMAWGFLFLFVIPLLMIGSYRLAMADPNA